MDKGPILKVFRFTQTHHSSTPQTETVFRLVNLKKSLKLMDKTERDGYYALLKSLSLQRYQQVLFVHDIMLLTIDRALEYGYVLAAMQLDRGTDITDLTLKHVSTGATVTVNQIGEVSSNKPEEAKECVEVILTPVLSEYFDG